MLRKLAYLIVLIAIAGFIPAGCAKKKIVTDLSTSKQSEQDAQKGKEAKPSDITLISEDVSGQEIASADEDNLDTSSLKEGVLSSHNIYFEYDRYSVTQDAVPVLIDLSNWLINNNGSVLIEGHCDERGTNHYNIALGDRRAIAAREFLIGTGISPNRINTVSYGEERPACADHIEKCWTQNRRDHFLINDKANGS